MKQHQNGWGHALACLTVVIWGTTFISTKLLLNDFTPVEILFFRFCLGFLTLLVVFPRRLRIADRKQELYFAAAGLCGVTLYFLMENIALTYTLASNVGVIVSIAPFFTAILAHFFLDGEILRKRFFVGFAFAIVGIFLISWNGTAVLKLNPRGDLLAVLASMVWAGYSILTKRIGEFGYHTVQTTRRIFFYGILFMIPALFFLDFHLDFARFVRPEHLGNLLYLGLGASALCFVTWNFAVKVLGAMKTSVYIYMVPVVTVATSAIVLHEPITWYTLAGTALTLTGLFLSESKAAKAEKSEPWEANAVSENPETGC